MRQLSMAKSKVVTRTVILNGTKVWLTVLSIVCTYGGGSIWWAATQTTTLGEVKKVVAELRLDVKELQKLKGA
jgi:hypothetical protein